MVVLIGKSSYYIETVFIEKTKNWFGYNLHLIVDTKYELPVAFSVTEASAAEEPEVHRLLGQVEQNKPTLLEKC
ncbi:MAG: transposase [Bacillota bacterium]